MPVYMQDTPTEAVAAARRDAAAGKEGVWEALDGCLRWFLITYLQDRRGEVAELRKALVEAASWARSEDRKPWCDSWPYLIGLLHDAETTPAIANDLRALESPTERAAELLAVLLDREDPMRPRELAEALGMSKQQVSNLTRELESADLIVRYKYHGRARWVQATPRALRLAPYIRASQGARIGKEEATDEKLAPKVSFWNEVACQTVLVN